MPKELLYCWVTEMFCVLAPKKHGHGFLKVPYGHHYNPALSRIADQIPCDAQGLDGALEFLCGGKIFDGGEALRKPFASVIIPALEKHYGLPAREISRTEFWRLPPLST